MKFPISIPTREADSTWGYTEYLTRESFKEYIQGLFKEPGEYAFDQTVDSFNENARNFKKNGFFTSSPKGTTDYKKFWKTMRERCRRGVIFKSANGTQWYLSRQYYHWINFLKIYNKELKEQTFPDVLDAQYHMALYELDAELCYEHAIITKKRQFASSYWHIARQYNRYVHDVGFIGKLGASDKKYIDDTGSWKFLAEYRDFNNQYTGWYRPNFPEKPLNWKQQQEVSVSEGTGIKKLYKGTKAKITGHTFDKSPSAGVGGATDEMYYEEAGIAPTLAKTYGYMKPAMEYGMITTGLFIAAGSVGELAQAQDLYKFLLNPKPNGFHSVKSNLLDKNGTKGETGLFIPEQWSMPPYIDHYGNSLVKEALLALNAKFDKMKKEMDASDYQLYVSQHPRNIEEAFAIRTLSVFPVKHTTAQIKRIEDNEYSIRYVDLEYNDEGKIYEVKSDKLPITQFPIDEKTIDKEGVICIHESPVKGEDGKVPWMAHIASVDPVEKGKVQSTTSLFSIYIWKMGIEVTKVDAEGNTNTFIEGNKIVAWWVGRFDDVNHTNERARLMVEYYNAYTLSENQKTSFINYLIGKNMTRHLVPRTEILFDKELENKQNNFDKFGWSKSQALWKIMLEYAIDSLSEELDRDNIPGTERALKIVYGVTRIPDIMLLKEMQQYDDKGNFDRIISYTALIAFVKKLEAERGIRRITRREDKLNDTKKVHTFNINPFRSIGRTIGSFKNSGRGPFRSIG